MGVGGILRHTPDAAPGRAAARASAGESIGVMTASVSAEGGREGKLGLTREGQRLTTSGRPRPAGRCSVGNSQRHYFLSSGPLQVNLWRQASGPAGAHSPADLEACRHRSVATDYQDRARTGGNYDLSHRFAGRLTHCLPSHLYSVFRPSEEPEKGSGLPNPFSVRSNRDDRLGRRGVGLVSGTDQEPVGPLLAGQ